MAGQEDFYARLSARLAEDTGSGSLVALTGHATNDPRIIRYNPVLKAKQQRLMIRVAESVPLNENVTLIQVARVLFISVSSDPVLCVRILDRLESLLDFTDNRSYFDFSGGGIVTQGVSLKLRNDATYLTTDDVWRQELETEIIWSKISCPS